MTTLHSCCHCRQYCYSHRSSLSKLQFACAGLESSVWARADACCQACLLVEWLQPPCLIHSPVGEHLLVSAPVLGPGGGGAGKAQLCPDDGPGGGAAEGLLRAGSHACPFLHRPTASIPERAPGPRPRGQRWSWAPAPPGLEPTVFLHLPPSASSPGAGDTTCS